MRSRHATYRAGREADDGTRVLVVAGNEIEHVATVSAAGSEPTDVSALPA